jgi:nucleoside-diphosphate-sugar epimerase
LHPYTSPAAMSVARPLVLVLGGTGKTGQSIVNGLLKRDRTVSVTDVQECEV